ncbi:coagulation factor V-like [Lytechinus variegatus]|uniref:coagulation factor V-like n=1 Tax=Lytechinus variegatus TaxID=7654 RepID=UPI001BB1CDE0|nr:coagulation factor V-like [Lytechinus variegatus]
MKTGDILLGVFQVILITLYVGKIRGQTPSTAPPSTGFPGSTVTQTLMPAGEENITSTVATSTTMATSVDNGTITGDNNTTDGPINNMTTVEVSTLPPMSNMSVDNITSTLPPTGMENSTSTSDIGNSTSTPDMGNLTSTPDMGNSTSTPDIGNSTSTPDIGNSTSTPDIRNSTSTPDMGNSTSTPDMGNSTSTPDMGNSTSTSDLGNSTSTPDIGNSTATLDVTITASPTTNAINSTSPLNIENMTASTDSNMTTSEYVMVTMTSEYMTNVTDDSNVTDITNSIDTAKAESNDSNSASTGSLTTLFSTIMSTEESQKTEFDDTRKRSGPSIPVALYMSISVILALCVVLLLGIIAHVCASMRNRPTSYNISSRVNGHHNPAFDSGEVADDDEDNPVKGIMREPIVDIESGLYSDNERTPL